MPVINFEKFSDIIASNISSIPFVLSSHLAFPLHISYIFCNCPTILGYSIQVLFLLDVKSWLIWEDPDARKDWRQKKKGTTEDEMAGWPHWLDAHESGETLGVGDGQGGLVCCDSWGHKESHMTERLNWTDWLTLLLFIASHGVIDTYNLYNKKYVWLNIHFLLLW